MASTVEISAQQEFWGGTRDDLFTVEDGFTQLAGTLACLDGTNGLTTAEEATGLVCVGVACETVVGDGTLTCRVRAGIFTCDNSGAAAVTAAHIGGPCYVEDNTTVSSNSTDTSVAGTVLNVTSAGVVVRVGI